MLCAECEARIPIPDSPSTKCPRCGKNPLDLGDWGKIKELRRKSKR